MSDMYYDIYSYFTSLYINGGLLHFIFLFFPFVIILELPYCAITIVYSIKGWLRIQDPSLSTHPYCPLITIVVTAYNEGKEDISNTIKSIYEQIYSGSIETLIIVDNAPVNHQTTLYARQIAQSYPNTPHRSIQVIAKQTRGGHASSMNLGLKLAKGVVLVMIDADTSIDNQTIAKAAAHFVTSNVIAVSGAVRVRNIKASLITRLQTIEYMIGIQLGRFGLTELQVTNNISGAFGIFRTSFLKQIGGWLNGTAEDLDLTLRIHAYSHRYPHLKIVHEPMAIAWTAAPSTLKNLFKQRLRWDGDLYYIYVRRHWQKFNSKIVNKTKMFFLIWYGLYYQLALPFIVVFYTIVLFLSYTIGTIIGIYLLIYVYYLLLSFLQYFLFLLLVSERSKQDLRMIGWLFAYPFYQQMMRLIAVVFIMNEILFKGHKDTTMAPWWVIRKSK